MEVNDRGGNKNISEKEEMKFSDLSVEDFQKVMFEIKDRYNEIYETLMDHYFKEYKNCEYPIIESYKRDPDETWDAMEVLDKFFETK